MTDNDLDLEVQALTLQLQQLQVEQERLEHRLNRVQTRLQRRDRGLAESAAQGAITRSRTTTTSATLESAKGQCRQRSNTNKR